MSDPNPSIEAQLQQATAEAVHHLFCHEADPASVAINRTPREYEGQYTVVVFPFVRVARRKPEETGAAIGERLVAAVPAVKAFNVVKGFLNLELSDAHWRGILERGLAAEDYGRHPATGQTVVLEYCGPNTNKPLHLGHIRNMLLGWSVAEILSAAGHDVHKVNIYNDRGIAICKSMAAYEAEGEGATPASAGVKGDHFVGGFYVAYNRIAEEQAAPWLAEGLEKREAEKRTPIFRRAQEMLLAWEAGDADVRALWTTMNGWVYAGFNETFAAMGVDFERDYLESETYLEGRDIHPGPGHGRTALRRLRHAALHLRGGQRTGLPLPGPQGAVAAPGPPLRRGHRAPFLRHGGPALGPHEVPRGHHRRRR
jgi:arginyl-tRNA synthetase